MESRIRKQRGINVFTDQWLYGHYFFYDGKHQICNDNTGRHLIKNPETIGDFTGITDTEGNEWYEGDILADKSTGKDYVIQYDENLASFVAQCRTEPYWTTLSILHNKKCVKKGTIHDHLLAKQQQQ